MLSKKVSIFKPGGTSSRPKSAHQSVRGRISGPIPMTTEDDEFPIRKPGTAYANEPPEEEFPIRRPGHTRIASALPLDTQTLEKETAVPEKEEEPQPTEPETPKSGDTSIHVPEPEPPQAAAAIPQTPSRPAPSPPAAGPSPSGSGSGGANPEPTSGPAGSPVRQRTSPAQHRTNPSNTVRYSQVSAASTGGSSKPQRKKSTLRGALSRLFGRKKKTGSQASTDTARTSRVVTSDQHRSDPSALNRAKEVEPKRSASLPITEFDRALRSHSVGPDDMTAIESARNSLQVEASPNRRRAVTTSSRLRIYSRKFDGEFAGLSPRPASTGKGVSGISEAEDSGDPAAIGRALTSDSNGDFTGRRRSRSLSGLQDLVAPQSRRRSDEIRYWRESYDPTILSPLSSGNDVDNNDYVDNDETGAPSVSVPESPHLGQPPKTPPQPFNFGSLANNEMAGMKITQAVSLDMRIGALESRMMKLERSVNQLCHTVPGFKGPLMDTVTPDQTPRSFPEQSFAYTSAAPPMIPAIYQTISAERGASSSRYSSSRHSAETDAHSHMSFGEGQTYIGSLHPPSSSATQAPALTVTAADRPTSTSTVRGATSLPSLNAHGAAQPDDLVTQLEAERAARQALETQVKKLSDRLNGLSTTMFAMVGGGPAKSRSQERLTPASSPAPPAMTIAVPPIPKARSVFEDDSDVEDAPGFGAETPSEAFQTPREERYPQYRTFGVDDDDDEEYGEDGQRKKASRTLSLSQLTMGKKAQPAQI